MTFKRSIWFPIAAGLSVVNLVAAGFAIVQGEPWHAAIHGAFALALGFWAQHLRQDPGGNEFQARLDELEVEVSNLRRELSEIQERLDFAERLLAQSQDAHRVNPPR